MADPERTPLLNESQRWYDLDEPGRRLMKWARWVARSAVVIVKIVTVVALIISLYAFYKAARNRGGKGDGGDEITPGPNICKSPACVHASSEILYNLSPKYKELDPCTNFEELVCGGWDERHDLRPDQGDAFTGTIMSENSEMLLRQILEAPYPDESAHSSFSPAQLVQTLSSVDKQNFDKLKTAYDACMDVDTIKKLGLQPLQDILDKITEKYPATQSAPGVGTVPEIKDNEALTDTIVFLYKIGLSPLISLGVGADDKDPDTVVIQASAPWRVGLPANDYYKDEKVVKQYTDTITSIVEKVLFGSNEENTSLHSERKESIPRRFANSLVKFEQALAAASPSAEDMNDVTKYYNPMSLQDADKLAPSIQLAKIINTLAPSNAAIGRVIVGSPDYLQSLSDTLSKTPNEVLQIYFQWKVIQGYSSRIIADETKPYTQFLNVLQGKDPDSAPERWMTCVNYVDGGLGWILSRFFVEKAFSEKGKKLGDQIVSDIKDMFIEKLKVTDWMDKDVVDLAIEKVHKIVQKIGYPTKSPNIMDPSSLYDYYRSVDVTATTYFTNSVSMNTLEVIKEWSSLGKPVDRNQWDMTVPTVNAYYNPPGNEIVFPAGIMQFPVFDVEVPQYLSYGAFGSVSGHELSHAFDSTGRHYDQNGNYTDWWTDATVKEFTKRADCFVDQYAEFTVPGPDHEPLHVNGKLTLGENIADAGGVSAAFAAWKKRQAKTPNEDLPGLDHFTQDQLFFVSYANWWCGKSRKETAITRIYTDPHAPKWARILGTMANSKDFRESFNCTKKEPVCELW